MQLTPSLAITQLLSALCLFTQCEQKYPSPVDVDLGIGSSNPSRSLGLFPSLGNLREFLRTGQFLQENTAQAPSGSGSNPSPSYSVTIVGSNGENSFNITNTVTNLSQSIVTRRGRLVEKAKILKDLKKLEDTPKGGGRDDRDVGGDDEEMMTPILDTPLGKVAGYHMKIVSGRRIYAFEG